MLLSVMTARLCVLPIWSHKHLTKFLQDVFGQSTASAAAIASIFGWMNLFARGLGGVLSDTFNESMGMRGRLIAQAVLLILEGIMVLVFARTDTLAGAVIVLVFFSLFVQSAEGTSYGIVPYICPPFMGSISGIVGAGGNVGAVLFGLGFRELDYERAFTIMGSTIIASSFLTAFISIEGHRGLFHGEDQVVDKETGKIIDLANDEDALLKFENGERHRRNVV
jgi:NNP family nitrate/nitrite transporter-like MFS transporter